MDMKYFNEDMLQNPLIRDGGVIIGGDFNFTLKAIEIWGLGAQLDPLSDLLINLLERADIVDVRPIKITPLEGTKGWGRL